MKFLCAIFRKKRVVTPQPKTIEQVERVDSESLYLSDEPIESKVSDRFGRAAFAQRIAETISNRRDPSSIVVGLYGPWGDGKTSVLRMMEESLSTHEKVVTIRFNPWHFPTVEALLRGFFLNLSAALGQQPGLKDKAADLLASYGGMLSAISFSIPLVTVNPGEAAQKLGESLSKDDLETKKNKIDALLEEQGCRVVVLIDDIDRLDKDETNAIFKLVKLSASFKYTCYVLAFDDEVVAAALGERYGAGGAKAGREFLEKIIQVPLHLPPADRGALYSITMEGINHALDQACIDVNEEDTNHFHRYFIEGLERYISTPRVAKLYANALMFALPLVKDEVKIVDFMLIEGLRIFHPGLYMAIRDNPDLFLSNRSDYIYKSVEERKALIAELVETAMPTNTGEERERVLESVLKPLFPAVQATIFEKKPQDRWALEKRICSERHFRRYFVYGVPDYDVSDAQVLDIVNTFLVAGQQTQRDLLVEYSKRHAMPLLISSLSDISNMQDKSGALRIATALARNGDLLPREQVMFQMGSTRSRAAFLISKLMLRIPENERYAAVEGLIQIASPLSFTLQCMRWFTDSSDIFKVLPDSTHHSLFSCFGNLAHEANKEEPIFQTMGKDAPGIYWYWEQGGYQEEIEASLRALFDREPDLLDEFLETYVGEAWEVGNRSPVRADLRVEQYTDIQKILSPDYIVRNLLERYGDELESPNFYYRGAPALITAHQFLVLHEQHIGNSG